MFGTPTGLTQSQILQRENRFMEKVKNKKFIFLIFFLPKGILAAQMG